MKKLILSLVMAIVAITSSAQTLAGAVILTSTEAKNRDVCIEKAKKFILNTYDNLIVDDSDDYIRYTESEHEVVLFSHYIDKPGLHIRLTYATKESYKNCLDAFRFFYGDMEESWEYESEEAIIRTVEGARYEKDGVTVIVSYNYAHYEKISWINITYNW